MLDSLLRLVPRMAKWGLHRFYAVDRLGNRIPDGPALVIANHPNSLVDALVIMEVAGRRVRPLAKAGLFTHALMGPILRGLGALPVYRRQDFPDKMERNEDTFREAVDALERREAVLIFPEGITHSEPSLAPLKTGAARIALRAEERADWRLGLRIVPVGLTYHRKHAFRGHVVAEVGPSIDVAGWRDQRRGDDWGAVESLTDKMSRALAALTINLASEEDRALIETAERLYAIEKRWSAPRDRPKLAPRLPRLRRFADALAWLREVDSERYERLAATVRNYRRRLELLGVGSGEVPKHFRPLAILRYALVETALLVIGLPLAVLGTAAWYLPYKSPRFSLGYYRPHFEAVATMKLATALLAFPVTFVFWLTLAWWLGGWKAVAAVALVLPLAGFVAAGWRDRWAVVREDIRLFWRSARRPSLRGQLVARRKALVEQFDNLAGRWQKERRRVRKLGSP